MIPRSLVPSVPFTNAQDKGIHWHVAVLLAFPIICYLINPSVIEGYIKEVDNWYYYGYFRDYVVRITKLYPDRYFGTRLSWLYPGILFYKIFNPQYANMAMHLGWFYAAEFAFYGAATLFTRRQPAFIATLFLVCHPWFDRAMGWDYISPGMETYHLGLYWCIAKAATRPRPLLWTGVAGAAAASAAIANVGILVAMPAALAYGLYHVTPRVEGRDWFGRVGRLAAAFIIGAALVFMFYEVVDYLATGQPFFLWPQIASILRVRSNMDLYRLPGYGWLLQSYWLQIYAIVMLAALGVLAAERLGLAALSAASRFAILVMLACDLFLCVTELTGFLFLRASYYTSMFMPATFLCLAFLLDRPFARGRSALVVAMAGLLPLFLGELVPLPPMLRAWTWSWFHLALPVFIGLGGLGLVFLATARRRLTFLGGLLLLVASTYPYAPVASFDSRVDIHQDSRYLPAAWHRVVAAHELIRRAVGPDRLPRFWFAETDPLHWEYTAINNTYFGEYSFFGYRFPGIGAGRFPPKAGEIVVILSASDKILPAAAAALAPRNLAFDVVLNTEIIHGGQGFRMIIGNLVCLRPDGCVSG